MIWYNAHPIGGNDSRQEREERGDPHATEHQFHESDSFAHKKVQNDGIIGKTRC